MATWPTAKEARIDAIYTKKIHLVTATSAVDIFSAFSNKVK
jgi:hypothetical protein